MNDRQLRTAFAFYIALGASRSLRTVATEVGVELQELKRLAARHRWRARARRIENYARNYAQDLLADVRRRRFIEDFYRTTITEGLVALGRLTMCTRQLDMLMDSDASPDFFARAFLADEMEKF